MSTKDQLHTDTEALIKAAAKKVFLRKGLAGTRLQEIADEAGIGRTALHYYFRNKEALFQIVWKEAFFEIGQRAVILKNSKLSTIEKMQSFASDYFEKALAEPELDIFMLNEFNNNPTLMMEILLTGEITSPADILLYDIEKSVKKGEMKGDPQQIFITLISMCIFPFAGKAMMKSMLKLDEKRYMKLMGERKQFVIEFLKTAFKV